MQALLVLLVFVLSAVLGTGLWGLLSWLVWNLALAPWQGWRELPWSAAFSVGFVCWALLSALRGGDK